VTDFGLVKRFAGESQVTLTGQVLGSPNYIPPPGEIRNPPARRDEIRN
jgi:hypothetical protein